MDNEDKNIMIPPIIKGTVCLLILEIAIFAIIFIINGQTKNAIYLIILVFLIILLLYICIRKIITIHPYFFADITNKIWIVSTIVSIMIIELMFTFSMLDKHLYKIGDIQIKFPKENGFVYGFKDTNNKYYYAHYYFDNCSIVIQKTNNNSRYSVFENIKNNVKLDNKITDSISLKDIYNSNFSEGKEIINKKEWNTYYTQVDNIKYTIYYIVIDDYIYQINTANYNENPAVCTDKINETFKTIKYKN